MARGRHDDVIAHRLKRAERLAVHLAVGDDGGHVVLRFLAAAFGQRVEIGDEVRDDGLQRGERRLGILQRAARAIQVRIGAAEEFLRQSHHERLVHFGHAQHFHDHMQRIEERHIAGEIAFAVHARHAIDSGFGDLARCALRASSGSARGNRAASAGDNRHARDCPSARAISRDGASRPSLLRTFASISMATSVVARSPLWKRSFCRSTSRMSACLRHHPERIEALGLGYRERHFAAQERERVVDALAVGVRLGVDDIDRDLLRNPHARLPWPPGGLIVIADKMSRAGRGNKSGGRRRRWKRKGCARIPSVAANRTCPPNVALRSVGLSAQTLRRSNGSLTA